MPSIFTHVYRNGLSLVGEPNPHKSVAAFTFLLPAGSATEPSGQEGVTALLENLLWCGAGNRDARQFNDAIDALGVERSGGAEVETTSLSAATLSRFLPDALRLYADILRRPLLPSEDFNARKSLACQALRSLDDAPARKMMVHLRRRFFISRHCRAPIGELSSLENLTLDQVRADFHSRYVPNGSILSVAGDFDWTEIVNLVGELLGDWQGTAPVLEAPQTVSTPLREHLHGDKEQVHIGVNFVGAAPDENENYAFRLANSVLSGGMGARLFSQIREKRGLVYNVSSTVSGHRGIGWTTAYAGTTAPRASQTLQVLLDELQHMEAGVSCAELDRARTKMLANLVMAEESTRARAASMARDFWILKRVRTLEEVERALLAVSPADISAYYQKFPPREFSIVTLGPNTIF